jgi:deoxyribodipyrimidine photolyase-related protein
MTTLRLILGDQLNPCHSWFEQSRADVVYVLMEIRQETDYVLHHAQKIIAIFAGMRDLARQLKEQGHRVRYLHINDAHNRQSLPDNLDGLIEHYQATHFEYQAPDEYRLDQQLARYCKQQTVDCRMVDSEHFYSARDEAAQQFSGRAQWLMENFYRTMRTRHGVLMDANKRPSGGQWNYDHDNRKRWPGTPFEPEDLRPRHDHSALWRTIVAAGVGSFGEPQAERFAWPLNRDEALEQLRDFIELALPHFGDYQDAMSTQAWRLFHSQLSFAMNTKMLNPREVIDSAEAAYRASAAPLAAVEGFIRQILGWREYVRGVYWAQMPGYDLLNAFGHEAPLPSYFWDGNTRMRCMAHALGSSLENAHAHHIQRLMVIGNFALLAGLDPAQVHQWYLGVYIDAFEWVELPNTLGMSQFADGGMLATKPYVSSAAYIDRMSDYCKGCHYDKKLRIGERACPYNALYWDFFQRNKVKLEGNHRLGMVYRTLGKMGEADVIALQTQAATWRGDLDAL